MIAIQNKQTNKQTHTHTHTLVPRGRYPNVLSEKRCSGSRNSVRYGTSEPSSKRSDSDSDHRATGLTVTPWAVGASKGCARRRRRRAAARCKLTAKRQTATRNGKRVVVGGQICNRTTTPQTFLNKHADTDTVTLRHAAKHPDMFRNRHTTN